MIEITRDGTDVVLTAVSGYPNHGTKFSGRFSTGAAWVCALLWQHLHGRMQDELRRIRQEAYTQGWKDAKAKKAGKETWFASDWR